MNITVFPAGQWGSALAIPLANNGHQVKLWLREDKHAEIFNRTRLSQSVQYPVPFPKNVQAFDNPAEALQGAELVIIGCASQALREVATLLQPQLGPTTVVMSIIKGLEKERHLRPSEVVQEVIPGIEDRFAVLSGPNFAEEVAAGKYTATVIASSDIDLAERLREVFLTPAFYPHVSTDVAGVELGGVLKNIVAIIAGISDGIEAGDNARAALVTRGFEEMCSLAEAYGAEYKTLYGLSGLGDLLLTSTGELSRNHRYGKLFAEGKQLEGETVEGVNSLDSAIFLAEKAKVRAPIATTLRKILNKEIKIEFAIEELLKAD